MILMNVKLYIINEAFADGLTMITFREIVNVAKSQNNFYLVDER